MIQAKKRNYFLVVLLSLISTAFQIGCGGKYYPSYSGKYELQGVRYSIDNVGITNPASTSDTFFASERSFPQKLTIEHRAAPEGAGLNHHINFSFDNAGSFTESLTRILNYRERVYYVFDIRGLPVAEMRPGPSDNETCWVQYYYVVNIRFTPNPTVLDELYSLQEYVGRSSDGVDLYETISPRQFEAKLPRANGLASWSSQLQDGSVQIEFDFSRQAIWDLSHPRCSLRLNRDIRPDAHIVVTYRSTILPGADSSDILTSGTELNSRGLNNFQATSATFRPFIGY